MIGDFLTPKPKTICYGIKWLKISLMLSTICSLIARADVSLEPASLNYTHTRALLERDPNLTGRDILIAAVCRSMTYINGKPQNDYRFNMNHNSLYHADVLFEDGTDGQFGISSHATAIAGILVGQDNNAYFPSIGDFQYEGICPDASVDVYEFWRFATLYLFDKQPFDADIITLSLGETFEDWWTRAFENLTTEQDTIVIASIGNGGGNYDMLYPGAGANIIGVGVVDAVTDANGLVSLCDFSLPNNENSSSGPTDDKRCKPDIVAPGTALIPAYDNSDGYLIGENWSSLAAPIVSGTTALLLQKAYSDETLNKAVNRPQINCVIKAILMNSAAKLPYWHKGQITPDDDTESPLDLTQGAGALDATAALDLLTAGLQEPGIVPASGWDNRVLDANYLQYDYTLNAIEPNQMITATLCWNYHYQNHYPFEHLQEEDADLRLELWGFDPNAPGDETLVDFCDSINDNVEHIYFKSTEQFTDYRIRVLFSHSQSIEQRYAIAWSVGRDTSVDNRWWYDLNGDNKIESFDNIVYSMIDYGIIDSMEPSLIQKLLNLSSERLQLLTTHWDKWKVYLTDRQAVYGD